MSASWWWKLTFGYPMICIEHCHFIDRVTGESVGKYRDRLGRTWMATGSWSTFRVACAPPVSVVDSGKGGCE